MKATEVLEAVGAAGVRLSLVGGRLRFQAPPGAYDQRLRALVGGCRGELVALLADRQRADADLGEAALAEVLVLLNRGARLARGRPGRQVVLEAWEGLARRWHAAGDARLHEVALALTELLARWGSEDDTTRRAEWARRR